MTRRSLQTLHRALSRTAAIHQTFGSMGRAVLSVVLALVLAATPANALQNFRLRLTNGTPLAFPVPTEANYDAGFVLASDVIDFDVDARTAPNTLRESRVSIRSTVGTLGGTKSIADLQWRRLDLATWNPMTTANVIIQAMDIQRNSLNDPWSNSIEFRILLDWADDAPGSYSAPLVVTLTILAP